MASTNNLCRTYVAAQNSSFPRNQTIPHPQFTFIFYVTEKHVCVQRQRPRIHTVNYTRHEFPVSIPLLESESGWNSFVVARILSDTPIPFRLENLIWLLDDEVSRTESNPSLLLSNEDMVRKISGFACRIIREAQGHNNYKLRMTVTIEKIVVASNSDYLPLHWRRLGDFFTSRSDLRRSQPVNISAALFRSISDEVVTAAAFQTDDDVAMRMLGSDEDEDASATMLGSDEDELGVATVMAMFGLDEDEAVAAFGLNQAAKSAVEVLQKLRYDGICSNGDGDKSRLICPICMEEVIIGSHVTRMPCSHMFHEDCILEWLKRGDTCPLCRFKLSIDYNC